MYRNWRNLGYTIYKNAVANVSSRFDRSYYRIWNPNFLNRSQWFSSAQIEELQNMVSDLQVELKEQRDATSTEEANMRLGLNMIVEIANKVKNGVNYF